MDYSTVNDLTDAWNRLEKMAVRLIVEKEGIPLSTTRYAGHVRLCYNGKPLGECKAQERCEAAKHLGPFLAEWKRRRNSLTEEAAQAAVLVNAAIDDLAELEAGGGVAA